MSIDDAGRVLDVPATHGRVHRTEVDGVRVRWVDAPGPLTARLLFACGLRDETLATLGVTHLVEHLAMCRLPRLHHEHNGHVGPDTTTFWAEGTPQEVVAFLRGVCEGLSSLPVQELTREAGVLDAEAGSCVPPGPAVALKALLGTRSYGLAPFEGPGPFGVGAEQVLAHAARFFTRDNALLTLTGPPPAGLSLPLPDGPAPERTTVTVHDRGGPVRTDGVAPGVCLAFLGDYADSASTTLLGVLAHRVTVEARRRRGVSYCVDAASFDLDRVSTVRVLTADSRPDREGEVAGVVWEQLCRLAVDGPTAAELDEEVTGVRRVLDDPWAAVMELEHESIGELLAMEPRSFRQIADEVRAVTAEDVGRRAARALRTAVLVVPPGTELDLRTPDGQTLAAGPCRDCPELPRDGQRFRPPVLARAALRAARRIVLVRTATGLVARDGDGDVHGVELAEVAGLMTTPDGVVVFGDNGCHVEVATTLFPGAKPLVDELLATVPTHLHFVDPTSRTD